MTQTLAVVVLFVVAISFLPWLVRRLQLRQAGLGGGSAGSRVLTQVAVGPQQRVVTVEVQHEGQRAVLVLGVTAQQIQCLHVLPAGGAALVPASFATEMAAAQALPAKDAHA
ncbi:flagellar protein FliO/FliZ [Paenacidovorax caeni]|jgi:flagellar protein FliO/FliZ|uniref:Flagellar protein FliO/FliZ n=1 Tax=Paenacidovorax caeni TaxID=343013 RepID=A0A1I7K6S6_9BURK|nr:flagellar biosynthetic protein FliO [Paenacidovorax caeni]SFU93136.1 flagellar protein FliO/FliZ [Paenacidovorax caeni]